MLFGSLTLIASLAAPIAAQTNPGNNPNPFEVPGGFMLRAGQPTTIQWTPTTHGPVTLTLRNGAGSNLNPGTVIASGIPNSGSYSVTLPADTTRNSDYTLQISSDSNPSQVNYTPQFLVESQNTVASVTDSSATTAATSTMSTITRASMRSASTMSAFSLSNSSTSVPSSASASSGSARATAETQAILAPTSFGGASKVSNVHVGMAAMLLGALALF
ncbi:MAG: hypothetical protein Q9163_004040 [Psora crenata]